MEEFSLYEWKKMTFKVSKQALAEVINVFSTKSTKTNRVAVSDKKGS